MNSYHSSNSKTETITTCQFSTSSYEKGLKKGLRAISFTLKSILFSIWEWILTPTSNELRIWQRRDRFGQTYWRIYDPISDRVI